MKTLTCSYIHTGEVPPMALKTLKIKPELEIIHLSTGETLIGTNSRLFAETFLSGLNIYEEAKAKALGMRFFRDVAILEAEGSN